MPSTTPRCTQSANDTMRLKFFTLLSGLLLLPALAQADLASALTPATQLGIGSNQIVFTGALTNTSPTDNLFLNNVQVSFPGLATNYLAADTNIFFANVPGILLPGEIYRDAIFGVLLSPAAPPGNYLGTITVQGGANIFATTNLSSQPFQISLPGAALKITRFSTNLVLSWPVPPADFVLQRNSNLTTTNWTTVTNTPVITNGLNQVTLSLPATNQFYRLKYP